jgi:choloylglycine hydrolase
MANHPGIVSSCYLLGLRYVLLAFAQAFGLGAAMHLSLASRFGRSSSATAGNNDQDQEGVMNGRNFRRAFLFLFAAMSVAVAKSAGACSVFCMDSGRQLIVGRNYDWPFDEGMIVINKRGQTKTAFVYAGEIRDGLASWTSKYGSITFVQYGRENAFSGMNEAGLTAHELWLEDTRYPATKGQQSLSVDQYVQYILDNYKSVAEIARGVALLRIRPTPDNFTKIHFFATDAAGDCVAIDFLDGKAVCHAKRSVPIKALTNSSYDLSVRYFKDYGAQPTNSSPARFSRLASYLSRHSFVPSDEAASKAFEVLDSVRQLGTVFQVVFDVRSRIVYFKSDKNEKLRYVNFDGFDYSRDTPSTILDVNADYSGDVGPRFVAYTTEANEALIRKAWANLGYSGTDTLALELLSHYPESFAAMAPK